MVVVLLTSEQRPEIDKAIRVGHPDVVMDAGMVGGVPKQCVCLVWRDDGPRTGIKTGVVVDENGRLWPVRLPGGEWRKPSRSSCIPGVLWSG